MNYIGLDFESSGTDPWGKHVPIQIGMAVEWKGYRYEYESDIGRWNWDEYEWSPEAEAVHKIDQLSLENVDPVWAVDIYAAAWLMEWLGWSNRMWNITVGWNVAGFDRQFITRWFPNLNRVLSYRTLDLNALVLGRIALDASNHEGAYKSIKKAAKDYANEMLGITEAERHNALVDAKAALYERKFLVGDTS